ncbi:MAG: SGNH/GDSL hydrolase family protein [Verrucomicrobia bacterium]|nr:SGNH/GDSL hydrolase family protein [Verrucomicrobiota bacterium]
MAPAFQPLPSQSRPSYLKRTALSLLSGLLVLGVLELGYRAFLGVREARGQKNPRFYVCSAPVYEFDPAEGYRYQPGVSAVQALIQDGRVVRHWPVQVNSDGLIGEFSGPWDSNTFNIAVFGDSFTANPIDSITWTDYLPEGLSSPDGRPVAVRNYGRDGYGMLQIVGLAATRAETLRPDLVLIAFLTTDLVRARTWRTVQVVDGEERVFTTIEPIRAPVKARVVDTVLIDRRVTADWCRQQEQEDRRDDPLLVELCSRYRRYRAEQLVVSFRDCRRLFILNRLLYKDPYYGLHQPDHVNYARCSEFRQDAEFVRDMDRLRSLQIPVCWVHLPILEEWAARRHIFSKRHAVFATSLESFGVEPVSLLSALPSLPRDYASLFLLPYDRHVSRRGARRYGEAMRMLLIRKGLVTVQAARRADSEGPTKKAR